MASLDQTETMKAPLRRLNAQTAIQQARVKRLKQELQQAIQEEAAVITEYRCRLIRCARADCLQLANMMQRKLPTELRACVYEHLCIEDRPIPVGAYYHFRKYDKPFDGQPVLRSDRSRESCSEDANISNTHADHAYGSTANNLGTGDESEVKEDETTDHYSPENSDEADIEKDAVVIEFEDTRLELPDGRLRQDHSQRPPSDMVMPASHIFNPKYVGKTISHEIQKVYYSSNTFSVCNVENAISNFLNLPTGYSMQKWSNGLPPTLPETLQLQPVIIPSDHISHLQVRVKLEHLESSMPKYLGQMQEYAHEQQFLRLKALELQGLKQLSVSSAQRKISIELIVMTELPGLGTDLYDDDRRFVNFLQAIRNTVYTLIHGGDNLRVKITHQDESFSPFPRDITQMFALTKQQWEHEKAVHQGQGDWTADFYLAPISVKKAGLCGGFLGQDTHKLLYERWGVDSVVDRKAKYPIQEGMYWPRGNRMDDDLDY